MLLFPIKSALIGAPLLRALSPAVLSICVLTVLNSILEATFHPRISVIAMSVGALLKIVSGYVLIDKLGIIGAPISTGICYLSALLISLTLAIFYAKVCVPINAIFVPCISSFIAVAGARTLYDRITEGIFSIPKFIVCGAMSAVLYIAFICIFMQKDLKSVADYVKIAKKR